jgi:trans-AT polyketide synthase/acyltransferase/oxidoreductase domain-containing protein
MSAPAVAFDETALAEAVSRVRETVHIVQDRAAGWIGLAFGSPQAGVDLLGTVPPCYPEWLGDRSFLADHGARFPYAAGEMANGIATTRMVIAMAQAGMLGFFGAGGLAPDAVESSVAELTAALRGHRNWGVNLIHSPNEPGIEDRVAGLLLTHGVPIVSASAFMSLTPAVVRCSASGLAVDREGRITRRTRVIAKVSRPEVAEQFMSPAPPEILDHLVAHGLLSAAEADLARRVPVADDVTAEADSGGHTDNRPLGVLVPTLSRLADSVSRRLGCPRVRIGAAGGLGAPEAVAGAFATGAAYVVTGSINQSTVEAGLSAAAKEMLAQADISDVCMAPSSDMFELGVELQVLRRGSLFAGRAAQLYDVYRSHGSLDEIPADRRLRLEKTVLGQSFDAAWASTRAYWLDRDPEQVTRAERDPRHRMALVFRSYLGRSSHWAIDGEPARQADYQIWCGPAMGSFNRWIRGSFLDHAEHRTVAQVGRNLLEGAAVITRAQQLRSLGVPVPATAFSFTPRPLA